MNEKAPELSSSWNIINCVCVVSLWGKWERNNNSADSAGVCVGVSECEWDASACGKIYKFN